LPGGVTKRIKGAGHAELRHLGAYNGEVIVVAIQVVKQTLAIPAAFLWSRAGSTVGTQGVASAYNSVAAREALAIAEAVHALMVIEASDSAELTVVTILDAADPLRRTDNRGQNTAITGAFAVSSTCLAVGFQVRCRAGKPREARARAVAAEVVLTRTIDAATAVRAGRSGASIDVYVAASASEPRASAVAGKRARRGSIRARAPRAWSAVAGVRIVAASGSFEARTRAVATRSVDSVDALAAIQTGTWRAIVDIGLALPPLKTRAGAVAGEAVDTILATATVETRIGHAVVDIVLTTKAGEASIRAVAGNAPHSILTETPIQAGTRRAVVDVVLAPASVESRAGAVAAEAVYSVSAGAAVEAGPVRTIVDIVLATRPIEAWVTSAHETVDTVRAQAVCARVGPTVVDVGFA
jgi:hypothetical protein